MRRTAVLIATLLVISSFLSADDMEFNRKRLSIEYKSGIIGAWTEYGGGVGSYETWRFYKGFVRIKEHEFLDVAGYQAEAEQAKKHASVNGILMGVGYGTFGVAMGVFGYALWAISEGGNYSYGSPESEYYDDQFFAASYVALGVNLAALIPMLIVMARGEEWMPLQQAYSVAEDYNEKLLESMSK